MMMKLERAITTRTDASAMSPEFERKFHDSSLQLRVVKQLVTIRKTYNTKTVEMAFCYIARTVKALVKLGKYFFNTSQILTALLVQIDQRLTTNFLTLENKQKTKHQQNTSKKACPAKIKATKEIMSLKKTGMHQPKTGVHN